MPKRGIFMALVSVILIASLLLAACSSSTPATTTTTTQPAATTTTAPPPATTSANPTTTTAPPATTTSVASTTPPSTKVFELKFSYHTPPAASLVNAYFKPWTAAIEQATNGRVKITHYGAETLVKAKDQYDGLASGLSDIALVDTSETPGRFPTTEFDTLPYIFPDAATGAKIYWDILQKYSVATELKEVKVLAVAVIAPSNYVGNKSIQEASDFRGMRMRAAGKTESWTLEALGATPIEIATANLGTSIERRLVDGAFLSYSFILSMGIKDVTTYRTECNLFYRAWPIMMNKKVWDSMPVDLQNAVMSASGQLNSATYCKANEDLAAGAKNAIIGSDKGQGKPGIYILTPQQFTTWKLAVMPVWDKWAADLESKKVGGKAILADVATFTQKYSSK